MTINAATITAAITAIGALGTASFGLVDALKVFGGGPSRFGLGDIRKVVTPFLKDVPPPPGESASISSSALFSTLSSNWINGVALDDQKAKAKALIKLRLNSATAPDFAVATGVPSDQLVKIASLINQGKPLSIPQRPPQPTPAAPAPPSPPPDNTLADLYGRFDLALTALLDEGYQRADQRYRNSSKILAGLVAVIIAVFAGWLVYQSNPCGGLLPGRFAATQYLWTPNMWAAVVAGALATPIAPIAKDLTSAIAAGVDVVQKIRS